MRLILALCVALVSGEAFGSLTVLQVTRGLDATTRIGSSRIADGSPDDTLLPGPDGNYGTLTAESFQSNGPVSAAASASIATYFGPGVLNDNLLSISGHTLANTEGSYAGDLLAFGESWLRFIFALDEPTTFALSLSGGELTVKDDLGSDAYAATGATNASFDLQPGWYEAYFWWHDSHVNGDLPANEISPFSADLGFDATASVPESSTIAVWSVLALMGSVLPLAGRLRRLRRLRLSP